MSPESCVTRTHTGDHRPVHKQLYDVGVDSQTHLHRSTYSKPIFGHTVRFTLDVDKTVRPLRTRVFVGASPTRTDFQADMVGPGPTRSWVD